MKSRSPADGAPDDGPDPAAHAHVFVVIDADVCVGAAACIVLEPQAVQLREDGISQPVPGTTLPIAHARELVAACPSAAISIQKLGG